MGEWPVYKRLKLLKSPIRQWNTEVFGNIYHNLRRVEEELIVLDNTSQIRELDEVETARYQDLKSECHQWRNRKAQLMCQYSRSKSITDKDHNTKYFHALSSYNRMKNLISGITINGSILSEVEDGGKGIRGYFEEMYKDGNIHEIKLRYVQGIFTTVKGEFRNDTKS